MKKLCIYFSLFLLFGCVSVRSNVGAVPSFSKILVILKMNHANDDHANKYLWVFPKKYDVCAIAHDTISIVSLKERTDQWLNQCQSEAILTITTQQVGFYQSYFIGDSYVPNERNYEMFAEMRLLADNKVFWKSKIHTSPLTGETFNPKRIVDQLKLDGVLSE